MRKKLFAIVMSMTMVASFMPSLAFATYSSSPSHTWPTYTVDEVGTVTGPDAKYVKVVKAPVHTATVLEGAVVEETCTDPLCDDVREVTKTAPTHTLVNTVMTPAEYTSAKVAQGEMTETYASKWVLNSKCSVTAEKCKCGYVEDYVSSTAHSEPSTKKSCDSSYVCTVCSNTVNVPNAAHTIDTAKGYVVVKAASTVCGCGETREYTCSVCKEKFTKVEAHASACACVPKKEVTPEKKKNGDYILDGVKIAETETSGAVKIIVDGYAVDDSYVTPKFYVWDTVITPAADCASTQRVGFTCKYCDQVINGGDYANVGVSPTTHDWETKELPATCEDKPQVYKVCKVCGKYQNAAGDAVTFFKDAKLSDKPNSTANGHKLVVNKVDATCSTSLSYVITCSECDDVNTTVDAARFTAMDAKKGESLYVQADGTTVSFEKKTGSIELPYIEATTGAHKYTKKVVLREATCTESEIQGYKCDDCGKILVHAAAANVYKPVETKAALGHDFKDVKVAATCSDYGKVVKKCAICDLYLVSGTGTTAVVTADINEADSTTDTDAKPIVGLGANHKDLNWVVVKDATVFEEGIKQLQCSACGHFDETKTVVAKKTVAKAAPTVKAGKKSLTVKATAANATGYKVSYKKSTWKNYKTVTVNGSSLNKTIKNRSKGKYYVKVQAFAKNEAGDVVNGATSATKSVKVK